MDKMSIEKIKQFWLKYEQKTVFVVAFCLISVISFEFGVMQSQKLQQKPLIIEKPINMPAEQLTAQIEAPASPGKVSGASVAVAGAVSGATTQTINPSNCAYVGSRNSNKFYLPTCSYAKRVKPENLVCFKNPEQATAQGRTESKCK